MILEFFGFVGGAVVASQAARWFSNGRKRVWHSLFGHTPLRITGDDYGVGRVDHEIDCDCGYHFGNWTMETRVLNQRPLFDNVAIDQLDPTGLNVIQLPRRCTVEQIEHLLTSFREQFPGVRGMVVDEDLDFASISEEELADVGWVPARAPFIVYFSTVQRPEREELDLYVEPIRVESHEPLGWEPDFCCDKMAEAYPHRDEPGAFREGFVRVGWYSYGKDNATVFGPMIEVRDGGGYSFARGGRLPLERCPFCGAEIILVQHNEVQEVAHQVEVPARSYEGHHYEVVE